MAKRTRRRKCKHCQDLFYPDHRNRTHQKYCHRAPCRAASKKVSQARWLSKEENKNYFSGPDNVARVQEWRKRHPGYWKRGKLNKQQLQDRLMNKSTYNQSDTQHLMATALQDLLNAQSPVIIGLIANLTGNALQDDIAKTILGMKQLGRDILTSSIQPTGGSYDRKTPHRPAAYPHGADKIQLDRPPSGP